RLEVRQVAVAKITVARHGVEHVTLRLRTAVNPEVLHRGDGLEVLRVVPLQALDEGNGDASRQERIFPVRFLSAPPTGTTEEVDVRRPDGESLISRVASLAVVLMMFGARL